MLSKIPHTFVIVFAVVIFAAVLTWFVPGGNFQKNKILVDGQVREVIQADSFEYTESKPQTWQVFSALFEGFVAQAGIIIFILILGGSFWILNDSKAVDKGIYSFLIFTKKIEHWKILHWVGVDNIIFLMIMIMFSLFGAIFGMSEETIAFTIIFVPLAIRMGYDSIVGLCLCYVAANIGFAAAFLNPFTIGIAQSLANIAPFSGLEYRLICWCIINMVSFTFILIYAKRIKAKPQRSCMYEADGFWRSKMDAPKLSDSSVDKPSLRAWISFIVIALSTLYFALQEPSSTIEIGEQTFTLYLLPCLSILFILSSIFTLLRATHMFILNLLSFTIIYLIAGVLAYHWYIKEIASLFFVMGIASGLANNKGFDDIFKLFIEGCKDIFSAAIIVGLAGGIIVILQEGNIIDTLLYQIQLALAGTSKLISLASMYLFQSVINIFIPSGSAKAALTMPIMAQLSDLILISRQTTVLAFQFGDGFTNLITPTSGILIAVLGIARVPYAKWLKWILPLLLTLIVLGFLLLIPTIWMDIKDF